MREQSINVRYLFIREIIEFKDIDLAKIGAKNNATNTFTKVVACPKFKQLEDNYS